MGLQIRTSLQVLALQREGKSVSLLHCLFFGISFLDILYSHSRISLLCQFQVDVRKQRTAFPPNFVHSLDGTHMMMTAIACRDAGLRFAGLSHYSIFDRTYVKPSTNLI
jgi:hypothetical protein